ncbi:hypothetical protein B0H11DRAFT_1960849 [Mycena galericulata]|nr:hypothetical protein B0H11DRAFT_1960849 [Mycena galericulata]
MECIDSKFLPRSSLNPIPIFSALSVHGTYPQTEHSFLTKYLRHTVAASNTCVWNQTNISVTVRGSRTLHRISKRNLPRLYCKFISRHTTTTAINTLENGHGFGHRSALPCRCAYFRPRSRPDRPSDVFLRSVLLRTEFPTRLQRSPYQELPYHPVVLAVLFLMPG